MEGEDVRKGTSHFGKHTAQFNLDGFKLHIAAKLYAGHKPVEGARNEYFSNPFPYLFDGARALGGWAKKSDGDFQDVMVPSFGDIEDQEVACKICSVFFGHIPGEWLAMEARRMILVCLLSKWDLLVQEICAEPNGMFRDPSNHLLLRTLHSRLKEYQVDVHSFNEIKAWCHTQPDAGCFHFGICSSKGDENSKGGCNP